MATNAELNNSIIQLTRDVNDLTEAVNVKKQVLDTAVDDAEASETAAAASAAAAANSQTSASASAGAAAQSAADAAEVVTGGEGSLEPLPGKLPIADSRGKILPGWLENVPSRAEFFARAEQNKRRYAGSGFVEWGADNGSSFTVNSGLLAYGAITGLKQAIFLGRNAVNGESRTNAPVVNANGIQLRLQNTVSVDINRLKLPDAPGNTSLLSRQDIAFIEVWHEKVSDKDFVYPNGCVQYVDTAWEGITLVNNVVAASYSSFGAWEQIPVAGRGLRWSAATAAQRDKFLRDPANGFYYDTEAGELIQVRWRLRSLAGVRPNFNDFSSVGIFQNRKRYFGFENAAGNGAEHVYAQWGQVALSADYGSYDSAVVPESPYKINGGTATNLRYGGGDAGYFATGVAAGTPHSHGGDAFVLPIAVIQRRNQGAYHPVYNPSGCAKFLNVDNTTAAFWYDTDRTITSTGDCFSFNTGGDIDSSVSGRPDGLYYDQIATRDIRDLRNDANRIEDMDRYLEKYARRQVAGQIRGWEQGNQLRMVSRQDSNSSGYSSGVKVIGSDLAVQFDLTFWSFRDANDQRMVILSPVSGTVLRYRDNPAASEGNGESRWVRVDGLSADEALADEFRNNNPFPAYITQDVRQFEAPRTATHLHCDIIGDPANYPAEWIQNGVAGQPLVLDENLNRVYPADVATESVGVNPQTKKWKLSRKYEASGSIKRVLRWDGASWLTVSLGSAAGNWTFNTTGNLFYLNESTWGTNFTDNDVFMVFYETPANSMTLASNAQVLALGSAMAANYAGDSSFFNSTAHLTGKVATSVAAPNIKDLGRITGHLVNTPSAGGALNTGSPYRPQHAAVSITHSGPAVKLLPYLTRANGKAYLQLLFEELKSDGVDYGDIQGISVISSVSNVTDGNGATVIAGQKRVELPGFILDVQ